MMKIEREIQNILDRNFTRGDNTKALKELLVLYSGVSSRLISKAISYDKQLQALHAERAKIHSLATPTVIIKETGEEETVWIDETNHPNLSKINEMIERRTEQIKNFYS